MCFIRAGERRLAMRRYQFTFSLEIFGEKGSEGIRGYVDANNIVEIMSELMGMMQRTFGSGLSRDEFYDRVKYFDKSKRFGSTAITGLQDGKS